MRTIYILWLRQLKKYFRSKARILTSLAQPILFLLALGFGLGPVVGETGGVNYIDYLVPGIIAMSVLFTAMFSGIELIWDRQFGFLKETLVAPVSRFKILLGRSLGGATVASIQGILVFLICLAVGFKPFSLPYLFLALFFIFLIALIFTMLGTSIAMKLTDMQAFPLAINFIIMPLFFLSGALFPIDTSAKVLQIIANLNPLAYGVDGLRFALTGAHHFNIFLTTFILLAIGFAISYIGSKMFEKIEA